MNLTINVWVTNPTVPQTDWRFHTEASDLDMTAEGWILLETFSHEFEPPPFAKVAPQILSQLDAKAEKLKTAFEGAYREIENRKANFLALAYDK